MKRLLVARRISQTFSSSLFAYILCSTAYPLTGIIPAETFFKLDPLAMIVVSISGRVLLPGLAFSFVMLSITAILGRFFCGWICPLGSCIDAMGTVSRSTGQVRIFLRNIKHILLAAIIVAALFGVQIAWLCDPIVITGRLLSLSLIPSATIALDSLFRFLIMDLGLGGAVLDLHRTLKSTLLGVETHRYIHGIWFATFFISILLAALFLKRWWCRIICPLGSIYALMARLAPLRRTVSSCTRCKRCKMHCRMGAINEDISYLQDECILCLDCIYQCPGRSTRFSWARPDNPKPQQKDHKETNGISRQQFLILIGAAGLSLAAAKPTEGLRRPILRPPGSLREDNFLRRCIRCGNCMKVCTTNALQPTTHESGLTGIWTPRLVPEIGYCEYHCCLCGKTCPTGAIPSLELEKKQHTRLGLATIDRSLCLPWSTGQACLVCEEHCPVPKKAIKVTPTQMRDFTVLAPTVDKSLCIGCAICQTKCPVRPGRAIKVDPAFADRT